MENVNKSRSTSRLSMRGYFRDLNPDWGSFDHHDYQQFLWQHPCIRVLSLVKLPVIGVFFSKDVFSAKVQLLVSPQPYPSFFGRRVAKKKIRRTFNSKAFNHCFVRNVEKNGITPPTLFFFIQRLSPAFFTGVSLGVPGDFCWFSILLGSPKS